MYKQVQGGRGQGISLACLHQGSAPQGGVGQSWAGIATAETWLRPLGVSRGEMRMQMWHSTSRWGMWLGMLPGS